MKLSSQRGFTLIELLTVVAVIGLLASLLMVNLQEGREKARIARTVQEIRTLETASILFHASTGQWPATCRVQDDCDRENDPLLNALGVPGWGGPYGAIHTAEHGWGGHIGFGRAKIPGRYGSTSQPCVDDTLYLVFDDDAPGTDDDDNSGPIPYDSVLQIDEIIDDGDPATGKFLANDEDGTPKWTNCVSNGKGSAVYRLITQ